MLLDRKVGSGFRRVGSRFRGRELEVFPEVVVTTGGASYSSIVSFVPSLLRTLAVGLIPDLACSACLIAGSEDRGMLLSIQFCPDEINVGCPSPRRATLMLRPPVMPRIDTPNRFNRTDDRGGGGGVSSGDPTARPPGRLTTTSS
eukprot:gene10610-12280_t